MIKYAFKKSLPVMAGYIFLGIAFGIVLEEAGYPCIYGTYKSAAFVVIIGGYNKIYEFMNNIICWFLCK